MSITYKLNIKQWAEEDQPREKLLLKGKAALSNAELIGILIGSGTREHTAVDLAKIILEANNNDLNQVARLSVQDLKKFNGIGDAKAINIVSALEIGRRRQPITEEAPRITSSADVYSLMKPLLSDLPHEEFWLVLLNRANKVIRKQNISQGGISGTIADPKLIFNHALNQLASSIILVHNHPSGNTKPSEADKHLTKQLADAGKLLEIAVLDHIIFTDNSYFSFADENLL